jgi:hypothetical protein
MIRPRPFLPTALLLLESAGAAVYLSSLLQSRDYTIFSHGFRLFGPALIQFLVLWAIWFAALVMLSRSFDGRKSDLPVAGPAGSSGRVA